MATKLRLVTDQDVTLIETTPDSPPSDQDIIDALSTKENKLNKFRFSGIVTEGNDAITVFKQMTE